MKKLITLLAACTLCSSVAASNFPPPPNFNTIRQTVPAKSPFAVEQLKFESGKSTYFQMPPEAPAGAILWEDFAKFTEGSEAEPGTTSVGIGEEGIIPTEMTQMPGWTGRGIYQAGGMAYMGFFEGPYRPVCAWLFTPIMDLSGNGGAFTIKFRAKCNSEEGDVIAIMHTPPEQNSIISSVNVNITNEWADYSVQLDKGTAQSCIMIWSIRHDWFLDDYTVTSEGTAPPMNIHVTSYKGHEATVEWDNAVDGVTYLYNLLCVDEATQESTIERENVPTDVNSATITDLDFSKSYGIQVATKKGDDISKYSETVMIKPFLPGPELIAPTDCDGTSFTASWNPLPDAVKYYLYVTHTEYSWPERTVIDFQTETTETSYKVTDLEPEIVHSFGVQAQLSNGEITAISDLMKVLPNIPAPVATPATEVTADSFVANWTESRGATDYQVTVYKEHTASADGEYAIADANFDYIESEGTLETPVSYYSSYIMPTESGAFEWYINLAAMMDGAIGLDNSQYFWETGFMHSPLMDFTPFGGKASFDITLASADATKAIIVLAYPDEENFLQELESYEIPVSSTMTTQHVEFTKGTDNACIVVFQGDGTYLMFQDFKLTIDMPKGSKIEMPYCRAQTINQFSYKFENIKIGEGDRIGYDVMAGYFKADGQSVSEPSNRIWVDFGSSVNNVNKTLANVYMEGETLCIENPTGAAVEVYNMTGMKVFSDNSGEKLLKSQLNMHGVYIVKVGNDVVKVMR